MSRRLLKAEAIVLKTTKFGEIHKRITLLTDIEGIVYANAYGAAKGKSKLSGIVLPFAYLSVNLYFDPVKNSYKLSDAHPIRIHSGIHGNLKRYYAASAGVELMMKSFGGGEITPFFHLLNGSLETLEDTAPEKTGYVLIQFFWRFIFLSGLAPDFGDCSRCGRQMHSEQRVLVDIIHHDACCSMCAGKNVLPLNRGGVNYLNHTGRLPFREACRIGLDKTTETQLILLLTAYIEGIIEAPLVSMSFVREEL